MVLARGILLFGLLYLGFIHRSLSSFVIKINASNISPKSIWNPWSTENIADYTKGGGWLNTADIDKTKPTIKEQYPFLSHQKFAYSTGGCYEGYTDPYGAHCTTTFDLLEDPSDSNSAYNFSLLHIAIENVLKMGLKPYIVTGLIPIAYSTKAVLSAAKNLNELPPDNYTQYGEYIYSVAKYLSDTFGKDEVSNWWFGVITEYNNYRHFNDTYHFNDTIEEYFKIYDYTECSLKKALGENNFIIGAHSARNMAGNSKEAWDPDMLLNHVANEENACSKIKGDTQMDFYSSSFYETVSKPGDQSNFDNYICSMHDAVKKYGLQDKVKTIAIDEGRIINDQWGKGIIHRAVGRTYQASWDSLFFYNMIRCNISRFTRWDINTNGLGIYTSTASKQVSTIDPVSANVVRLTYKMNENKMLDTKLTMIEDDDSDQGLDADNTQIVNGMGGISDNGTVRVFVFNHNSYYESTQTANMTINVCDIKSNGNGKNCDITEWMIDDDHAQFWNIFWNDVKTHNITSFCSYPEFSNQSEIICFNDQKEHDYIQSRTPIYQNASKLIPHRYQIEYKANECLEISKQVVPSFGVRLFEIVC